MRWTKGCSRNNSPVPASLKGSMVLGRRKTSSTISFGSLVFFMRIRATITTLFLAVLALGTVQAQKPGAAAPAFEVLSLKHTGKTGDGGRDEGGKHYFRPYRGLQYKGVRLSGEMPLEFFLRFACGLLVNPWVFEGPDWLKYNEEFYQIEAIAPVGTTVDGARAMLRTALAERLGLKYHLVDRDAPVYALVRGNGDLKLAPSTETEPNAGAHQMAAFKRKSASLAEFASFISSLTDREVVDKTGVQGQYRFDVDWSKEVTETMGEFGRHGDPAIVHSGLKRLGLKLEPQRQLRKLMVVDRINKEPIPN
jgi:uncharacterized protein (TIGR03435 family)